MNIISIDWLQLYCVTDNLILNEQYNWHLAPYQTKQFRVLYEISYQNEEFATLCMHPVSHIIPSNAVIIKFKTDNCILVKQSITLNYFYQIVI
jgi:hypothetical protein